MKSTIRAILILSPLPLFLGVLSFLSICAGPAPEVMASTAMENHIPGDQPDAVLEKADSDTGQDAIKQDKDSAPKLPAYQAELLDLAFKGASSMPVVPLVKDRSKSQESVAVACFELGQPELALSFIHKIENWRRGAGYADYAYYLADNGRKEEVSKYLDLAEKAVNEMMMDEVEQDWRIDRIRVKIAKTYLLLGDRFKAAKFSTALVDSEVGKVGPARVKLMDPEDTEAFDKEIDFLKKTFQLHNFDQTMNGLDLCTWLIDRFYNKPEQRAAVEELVKPTLDKVPPRVALNFYIGLMDIAVEHGDLKTARVFGNQAQERFNVLTKAKKRPESRIALMADLAAAIYRSGDEESAIRQINEALDWYKTERDGIQSGWRAGALRPIAEAYSAVGDRDKALEVYKLTVEEGLVNPNSRPRAQDFCATCLSMGIHGVEPDADFWKRLFEVCDELGKP